MTSLSARLQAVRARIDRAARQYRRDPAAVRLLAVSKGWPALQVGELAAAGQQAFGENYVQEGLAKIGELHDRGLDWHFIGSLQANKTRLVAEAFDWVHSLDQLRIAQRLSGQRPASLSPLSVCLQVNVSGEASKGGVPPAALRDLAQEVAHLPQLRLRGLMTLPAASDDFSEQRRAFCCLRELSEQLQADGLLLDTLSMGMSHDLEAAIAEGATLVRVGTAIFGERT
ncbi:MAG: YggS family pyridoxal phosphate-dependent enzyme [Candidatus Accumulibacter sp. UW20]|jgi:pyridoxal phosphate enzyme (YggS family)